MLQFPVRIFEYFSSISKTELDALFVDARKAYGGTLLSVISGLERIIKETGSEAGG